MLEKVVQWAREEESIRAMILLGSRAGHRPVDAFSDYDLSVFCQTDKPYTQSTAWLSRFGDVLVCVKEKIVCFEKTFPSRLAIFEGGVKMDFSFLSTAVLEELVGSRPLPDLYNGGYEVLIDKDQKTAAMPPPQFVFKTTKPTEEAFHEVIEEFWFEIYHVGICLKRGDLWLVKERAHAAHSFLLRMIEWYTQAENGWSCSTPPLGKRMPSWVNKNVWNDLQGIFAHFDAEDSWQALFNTMELFRRLTLDIAQACAWKSLEELSGKMTLFIKKL